MNSTHKIYKTTKKKLLEHEVCLWSVYNKFIYFSHHERAFMDIIPWYSLFTNVMSVWQLKLGKVAKRVAVLSFAYVENNPCHWHDPMIVGSSRMFDIKKESRLSRLYRRLRVDKAGCSVLSSWKVNIWESTLWMFN